MYARQDVRIPLLGAKTEYWIHSALTVLGEVTFYTAVRARINWYSC